MPKKSEDTDRFKWDTPEDLTFLGKYINGKFVPAEHLPDNDNPLKGSAKTPLEVDKDAGQ